MIHQHRHQNVALHARSAIASAPATVTAQATPIRKKTAPATYPGCPITTVRVSGVLKEDFTNEIERGYADCL